MLKWFTAALAARERVLTIGNDCERDRDGYGDQDRWLWRPVSASPDTPLLYVLTNELELKGPRFGCGLAQCGSCSELADNDEIRSCVTPVEAVAKKSITTLEGLAAWYAEKNKLAPAPALHPLQQAFIDEQALHCGYCYNGMTIKGAELLARRRTSSRCKTLGGGTEL